MAELIGAGIGLVIVIISYTPMIALCISMIAVAIARYILEGIALHKMAKKEGIGNLWLIWVPYVELIGRLHILSKLSGVEGFHMFNGKINIKNRINALWIYLGIGIGSYVVSYLLGLIFYIPIVGPIITMIGLVVICIPVAVIMQMMVYAYVRDFANAYKPNQSSNRTAATLIAIFDPFTFGLVRAIYIFRMRNLEPLEATETITIE